jgi:hypothetical protein
VISVWPFLVGFVFQSENENSVAVKGEIGAKHSPKKQKKSSFIYAHNIQMRGQNIVLL